MHITLPNTYFTAMPFLHIFEEFGSMPMLMFLILLIRLLTRFDIPNDGDVHEEELPEVVASEAANDSSDSSSESEEVPTVRANRAKYAYGDYHPNVLYGISKWQIITA